jgi:hypothetical protein
MDHPLFRNNNILPTMNKRALKPSMMNKYYGFAAGASSNGASPQRFKDIQRNI